MEDKRQLFETESVPRGLCLYVLCGSPPVQSPLLCQTDSFSPGAACRYLIRKPIHPKVRIDFLDMH